MKCIKTILGGIRKADQSYNLFEEKDKVMIALLAVNALFCLIAQFVLLKE